MWPLMTFIDLIGLIYKTNVALNSKVCVYAKIRLGFFLKRCDLQWPHMTFWDPRGQNIIAYDTIGVKIYKQAKQQCPWVVFEKMTSSDLILPLVTSFFFFLRYFLIYYIIPGVHMNIYLQNCIPGFWFYVLNL